MIIQSIQRLTDFIRDNIVVRQYSQIQDPQSNKIFYECVTYTYEGKLNTYQDKGQNVDVKV